MGWLGWTEDETLAMTPAAILTAKRGRVDMINAVLKSVFPPAKPDGQTEVLGTNLAPTGENLRMVFAKMQKKGGGL